MDRKTSDPVVSRLSKALAKIFTYGRIDPQVLIDELQAVQDAIKARRLEEDIAVLSPAQVRFIADMLATWRSSPVYTDQRGEPRCLVERGAGETLESLYFESPSRPPDPNNELSFERVLQRLIDHGCVRRNESGLYEQLTVVFSLRTRRGHDPLILTNYLTEMAETCAFNVDAQPPARFLKVARQSYFPKHKLPMLSAILEEQGMSFLGSIDELLQAERDARPTAANAAVGVGLYLTAEDHDL